MTKKSKSVSLSKPSKKGSRKPESSLGTSIIAGLREAVAHSRGEVELRSRKVLVPGEVDVQGIREQAGLSQAEFAARFGFSLRTLQQWEQGRARPDNAVRAYLTVIQRDASAVERALRG